MMPAERAHHVTMRLIRIALRIPIVGWLLKSSYRYDNLSLRRECFGLRFKNPVGLAAGFDKDGKYINELAALGFGFIEVGTVTPRPQAGNPQPRLFRLVADQAIINRMGFNNQGVDALLGRLKKPLPEDIIIGANIGKNKDTPNERAHEDYLLCLERLYPYVHYFVINLSSPNTPGLRALQEKEPLTKLLKEICQLRDRQPERKPILLKIAPDLTAEQLADVVEIVSTQGLDGIVATNTTISRDGLMTPTHMVENIGAGGLSGAPVRNKSNHIISEIRSTTSTPLPIIGVGGINSADDAMLKFDVGAQLVQVYTGFVYHGPGLIKAIKKRLAAKI